MTLFSASGITLKDGSAIASMETKEIAARSCHFGRCKVTIVCNNTLN